MTTCLFSKANKNIDILERNNNYFICRATILYIFNANFPQRIIFWNKYFIPTRNETSFLVLKLMNIQSALVLDKAIGFMNRSSSIMGLDNGDV